jgi:hypothetical protein
MAATAESTAVANSTGAANYVAVVRLTAVVYSSSVENSVAVVYSSSVENLIAVVYPIAVVNPTRVAGSTGLARQVDALSPLRQAKRLRAERAPVGVQSERATRASAPRGLCKALGADRLEPARLAQSHPR